MGFDEYSKNRPLVNVKKPDTKTNLLLVVGVVAFFIIATIATIYYMSTPEETGNEVHRDQLEEAGS